MAMDSTLQIRMSSELKTQADEITAQEIGTKLSRSDVDISQGWVCSRTELDRRMKEWYANGHAEDLRDPPRSLYKRHDLSAHLAQWKKDPRHAQHVPDGGVRLLPFF